MLLSKLKEIRNGRMIKKTMDADKKQQVFSLLEKWFTSSNPSDWGNKGSLLDRLKGEIPGLTRQEASNFHAEWARTKDSKTTDVSYEVIWKEKQGGSEQRRVFPSKEEADRFVAHKERVDSRSYGVIVLKAFDSKTKDDFTVPLTVEEIKSLFVRIDPAYARMLSGVVTSKQMAVQRGLEKGLKLSSEGMQFKDSKMKDEKIISIVTPKWEGDIKIVDSTHFEMKAAGTDKWSWALHIGQVDDHVLNALKAKGILKDNGRFFNTDAYDPTQPKNIVAAKKLSVAQGKAAVGDEKFPVGSYVRVNIMGSKPEQVIRRDGTTVWTNKGTYHETKVTAAESNDSFTGIESIKIELKEAEDDLTRAKARGDVAWIREASNYVAELKKELTNWHKNNDADFKEEEHPREGGKFVAKGGGGSSSGSKSEGPKKESPKREVKAPRLSPSMISEIAVEEVGLDKKLTKPQMEKVHNMAMKAWESSKGNPREREQDYYEAVAAFTSKFHLPEDDVSESAKELYNEKYAKFIPGSEYKG